MLYYLFERIKRAVLCIDHFARCKQRWSRSTTMVQKHFLFHFFNTT